MAAPTTAPPTKEAPEHKVKVNMGPLCKAIKNNINIYIKKQLETLYACLWILFYPLAIGSIPMYFISTWMFTTAPPIRGQWQIMIGVLIFSWIIGLIGVMCIIEIQEKIKKLLANIPAEFLEIECECQKTKEAGTAPPIPYMGPKEPQQ